MISLASSISDSGLVPLTGGLLPVSRSARHLARKQWTINGYCTVPSTELLQYHFLSTNHAIPDNFTVLFTPIISYHPRSLHQTACRSARLAREFLNAARQRELLNEAIALP